MPVINNTVIILIAVSVNLKDVIYQWKTSHESKRKGETFPGNKELLTVFVFINKLSV